MRKDLLLAALLLDGAAFAQTEHSDLAKRFGAREAIQQVSMSPDGNNVVAIVPGEGHTRAAVVMPISAPSNGAAVIKDDGKEKRLGGCDWASDHRLICSYHSTIGRNNGAIDFGRMIALDPDGRNVKLLTASTSDALEIMQNGGGVIDWLGEGGGSGVLMTRQFVRTESGSGGKGLGVESVDPITLKRRTIEQPREDAREYITDGHGSVRVLGVRRQGAEGYDLTHIDYFYRKNGDNKWLPLSRVSDDAQSEKGFDPYAVDRALNVAYGFDEKDGHRALYKIALDGSLKRDLVYSDPKVDIDGLVRIGRQGRVVGVTYATDRRTTNFFDPELKDLQAALARALPTRPLVYFVDSSADESKLLLWTGSDINPGEYRVFDKKTRHLDLLQEQRSELDDLKLATVKSISFPAGDGTAIPAYLTLPVGSTGQNLPTIVMPHGGPSDRDEWGFDWLVQFFAARGYAVLQPNFRGSSGYGNSWFQDNGFRSWKVAIGDVNDAGRWLIKEGIADPGKLAIFGWSYGGYAALQSAVLDPDLYKAIIAVAPVTDLSSWRQEHVSYSNYKLVDAFVGKGPHVQEGSPAKNAERVKAPVLIFHGDLDQNVFVSESRLMSARLKAAGKKVDYVEFKGLDHQLDDSNARAELLDRSDAFLRNSFNSR